MMRKSQLGQSHRIKQSVNINSTAVNETTNIVSMANLKTDYPRESIEYLEKTKYIIDVIKCKFRDRSNKNQSDLLNFFLKADYEREMKNDLMYGTLTVESLFYFSSQFMDIKQFKPNEVIYYEGDSAEKIYLILLGRVLLKRLNKIQMNYSAEEYFVYLKTINNDTFLLNKTIEINNEIFQIRSSSEIEDIASLIIKAKILRHAEAYEVDLINIYFKIKHLDPENYGFDEVLNNESSIQAYYEDFLYSLTQTELFYIKQLNNSNRNKVIIYEYSPIAEKKKMDYFGNFKLGNSTYQREESAIATSNILLIEISKKVYSGCILNDQKQLREKELDHLHQSYFFKGIRKNIFAKYIFNELDIVEYNKDHILYNENETVNTLFILKEGTVEISLLNKTLIDIKGIIAFIKSIDERFRGEEFNDVIELTNSPHILMPYLKEKKNHILMKTSINVFCDWEFYYSVKSLFTVKVCSDKTKMYQIPLDKIRTHLGEDLNIMNRYLRDASYNKLSNLLKRLIMIKNAAIEKIDIEYTSRTKREDTEYCISRAKLVISKSNEKILKKVALKSNDIIHSNCSNNNSELQTIIHNDKDKIGSKHKKTISMNCILSNHLSKQIIHMNKKKKTTLVSKENSISQSFRNNKFIDDLDLLENTKHYLITKDNNSNSNIEEHNAYVYSPVIVLPQLKGILPLSKVQKDKRDKMLFRSHHKKQSKRIINLDIPQNLTYGNNQYKSKTINYLAVHKFYENNKTNRININRK